MVARLGPSAPAPAPRRVRADALRISGTRLGRPPRRHVVVVDRANRRLIRATSAQIYRIRWGNPRRTRNHKGGKCLPGNGSSALTHRRACTKKLPPTSNASPPCKDSSTPAQPVGSIGGATHRTPPEPCADANDHDKDADNYNHNACNHHGSAGRRHDDRSNRASCNYSSSSNISTCTCSKDNHNDNNHLDNISYKDYHDHTTASVQRAGGRTQLR